MASFLQRWPHLMATGTCRYFHLLLPSLTGAHTKASPRPPSLPPSLPRCHLVSNKAWDETTRSTAELSQDIYTHKTCPFLLFASCLDPDDRKKWVEELTHVTLGSETNKYVLPSLPPSPPPSLFLPLSRPRLQPCRPPKHRPTPLWGNRENECKRETKQGKGTEASENV